MLKQRVITACVLLAGLLVVIIAFSPQLFAAAMALIMLLAAWEWGRLAGLQSQQSQLLYAAALAPLLYLLQDPAPALRELVLYGSLAWWLLALALVLLYPRCSAAWNRVPLLLLAGLPVLLPGWLGLLYLRSLESYGMLILLFVGLVAAADIGAFFAGRRFGRHKLAPEVSPNKTWEGVVGGLGMACVVLWAFLLFAGWNGTELSTALAVKATLGTLVLAVCSVVGDLFESMLKRQRQMKDSGTLLPGHGGVLDRIDSITAALPVFTLVLLDAGLL
jgi:phosphatidate cytidylyltransferase